MFFQLLIRIPIKSIVSFRNMPKVNGRECHIHYVYLCNEQLTQNNQIKYLPYFVRTLSLNSYIFFTFEILEQVLQTTKPFPFKIKAHNPAQDLKVLIQNKQCIDSHSTLRECDYDRCGPQYVPTGIFKYLTYFQAPLIIIRKGR